MPILYFLSLGPISLLLNRAEPDMPEWLEVACECYLFPAEFVYELSPEPVRNVLTDYVEWCYDEGMDGAP